MLTDSQLRSFKPQDKPYKVTVGHGLYVTVTPAGSKSFRYDYRLNGKRETLTIGRYKDGTPSRSHDELVGMDFGSVVSLADARALHDRATRMVQAGFSPSKAKVEKRLQKEEVDTFGGWASRYLEFKADPKSGDEMLADSTLELRKSIYRRILEPKLAKLPLVEIRCWPSCFARPRRKEALAQPFTHANSCFWFTGLPSVKVSMWSIPLIQFSGKPSPLSSPESAT